MLGAGGGGRPERRDGPCGGLVIEVPAIGGGRSARSINPGRGIFSCTGPEQEECDGSKDQECDNARNEYWQEIRFHNNLVDDGSTPLRFSA